VSRRAAAIAAVEDLAPRMLEMWTDEGLSLRAIGNRLNEERHATRTDKPWSLMAVKPTTRPDLPVRIVRVTPGRRATRARAARAE
jgi:hypothetical protein